jgi:antitoxin (DNA-binding transcriptional repressor) of toxin-antitoxin stability system
LTTVSRTATACSTASGLALALAAGAVLPSPIQSVMWQSVKYDNLIDVATRVSATEAVRTFSDLLNRIRYRGEEFVVERGGETICRMTPAAAPARLTLRELAALLQELPQTDARFAADVRRASRKQGRLPRSPWGR